VPRIPFGLGDVQLPATGGIRGGTVGIPAVQEPGLDLGTATLPARGVAALGQQIEQAGQYVGQAEDYAAQAKDYAFQAAQYQAQRGRAQDALDSTRGFQEFVQRYQPALAKLAEGDYRTMPEQAVQLGKSLADQVALERNLSPEAKALFRVKAEDSISHAQQKALEVQSGRREQDVMFANATEIQQIQQLGAEAQTEDELQMVFARHRSTLQQMVTHGLMHGDVAAATQRKSEETVRSDRALRYARQDPVATFNELLGMAAGQPASSAPLQHLPAHLLNGVMDKVVQQIGEQAGLQDRQERHAKVQRVEQQSKNAIQYRADLAALEPKAANVQAIEAIITQIREAGPAGHLDENSHAQLLNFGAALREAALRPIVVETDPVVEAEATNRTFFATTPDQFNMAREYIAQSALNRKLTPDKVRTLLTAAESRENTMNPYNREAAKIGRRTILGYFVPGATEPGPATEMLHEEQKTMLKNALISYDAALKDLDPHVVDRYGQDIAYDIIRTYLMQPSQLAMISNASRLPLPLQTGAPGGKVVRDLAEAEAVLNRTPYMTDAEKGRYLREFEQFATSDAGRDFILSEHLTGPPASAAPAEAPKPWLKRVQEFFAGPGSSSTAPSAPVRTGRGTPTGTGPGGQPLRPVRGREGT
jgi:hypothetical protein